ncbi:S8 family serine peptidase [bacterium]|nr:S8 family serine peptidase [bacterium]
MAVRIGPLLKQSLESIGRLREPGKVSAIAAFYQPRDSSPVTLPCVALAERIKPAPKESWQQYRNRVHNVLGKSQEKISREYGLNSKPLLTANGLRVDIPVGLIDSFSRVLDLQRLELDARRKVTLMDKVVDLIRLDEFRAANFPGLGLSLDGRNVRVAVLDSGVDASHPDLKVSRSFNMTTDPLSNPGDHGTHCAGSIASRSAVYRGIAPGCKLVNIRVLDHEGYGSTENVTLGIDQAIDDGCHVISMSLGWNHIPEGFDGHGWHCPNADCQLCRAVNNAALIDNVVVVAAAGNEHQAVSDLRGQGVKIDTELCCPGQAANAITVAAVYKQNGKPAWFSSRGPTANKRAKPDLAAPGVQVWSTVPVPRDASNKVRKPVPRNSFGEMSGTSMATPIVAGVAALLIQRRMEQGRKWTAAQIKNELLKQCIQTGAGHTPELGLGRLKLA